MPFFQETAAVPLPYTPLGSVPTPPVQGLCPLTAHISQKPLSKEDFVPGKRFNAGEDFPELSNSQTLPLCSES